eukprot:jgi/Botrbrau1/16375/Bobra.0245s0007.1
MFTTQQYIYIPVRYGIKYGIYMYCTGANYWAIDISAPKLNRNRINGRRGCPMISAIIFWIFVGGTWVLEVQGCSDDSKISLTKYCDVFLSQNPPFSMLINYLVR